MRVSHSKTLRAEFIDQMTRALKGASDAGLNTYRARACYVLGFIDSGLIGRGFELTLEASKRKDIDKPSIQRDGELAELNTRQASICQSFIDKQSPVSGCPCTNCRDAR